MSPAHAELVEQVAHVHRRERLRGVAAAAGAPGSLDQPGMEQVDLHPGVAERQQPLHRRRAGAQGWRSGDHPGLPLGLGPVQQRGHQSLTGFEPPEHRALANTGPGGDRVHGHAIVAAVVDQLLGGAEQGLPVARGVAAFGRRTVGEGKQIHNGDILA